MAFTIVMEKNEVLECDTLEQGVAKVAKFIVSRDRSEPVITSIFENEIELDNDITLKFEQDLHYAIQIERQASEQSELYHRDCDAMIYRSVPCAR